MDSATLDVCSPIPPDMDVGGVGSSSLSLVADVRPSISLDFHEADGDFPASSRESEFNDDGRSVCPIVLGKVSSTVASKSSEELPSAIEVSSKSADFEKAAWGQTDSYAETGADLWDDICAKGWLLMLIRSQGTCRSSRLLQLVWNIWSRMTRLAPLIYIYSTFTSTVAMMQTFAAESRWPHGPLLYSASILMAIRASWALRADAWLWIPPRMHSLE